MGNANTVHRPLMAGLEIRSKIPGSNQSNRGTLTGLATRNSNGEKVLVSNLHVMTDDKFNPSTNAEIYQPDATDLNHKVGRLFKWVPLKTALPN